MTLQERINALAELGDYIGRMEGKLEFVIRQDKLNNGWFTVENTKTALLAIRKEYLDKEKLEKWAAEYHISDTTQLKRIGLILAGNIPLVGFQDVMNVFVAGHHAHIKLSDKDKHLLPHLLTEMSNIFPDTAKYFSYMHRMENVDAVIATGSNNTARYFKDYFGKYPHIIRMNRNSIAVLNGKETDEDFSNLARDVFTYFGLGCRNVSKLYVPKGYDFNDLLTNFHEYKQLVNHGKYKNNFDYNIAFNILNKTPYYNNGAIVLIKNKAIPSRIAHLHYEEYTSETDLYEELSQKKEQIQCIVSNNTIPDFSVIPFGDTQTPSLWDYADGVDTMAFLVGLSSDV